MQTLRELQHDFITALFDERNERAYAGICNGRFNGARLLQVYRNNIFISLTAALAAVYPVVQRLVGEGFFKYAADAFIRAHPPASGNLHDFGAGLAD